MPEQAKVIAATGSLDVLRALYSRVIVPYEVAEEIRAGGKEAFGLSVFKASIEIPSGDVLEGALPGKQMKLVQAWIALHADELMADWELASSGESPYKIEPLR